MEMQTLKKEKNNKRRNILIILAILILLLVFIGVTYSFYAAKTKFVNKSQTIIKTNQVSLVYTGVKEITTGNSMIPGDSFTKTFTVENTSDTKTAYNIYMEQITNEFNEDLVFVLSDDNGEVVAETPLPVTNTGKSYLLKDIEIDGGQLQSYTLKIEFKYLDTPQNDYQGKNFKATVGIDANQIENVAPTEPVALKYYAFGLPTIESSTNYNDVIASSGSNTFVQLEDEKLSVCVYRNNTLECFKNNNYEEEAEHLKQVFGETNCSMNNSGVYCGIDSFKCDAYSNGRVCCSANNASYYCNIESDGSVNCY